MAVIQLRRKSGGGRPAGEKSDVRVYVTSRRGKPQSGLNLGVRLSHTVLKRVRWLNGDSVTLGYDESSDTWTMRRVTDNSGNALSQQGKNGGDLTVRYAIEPDHVAQFGLDVHRGADCHVIDVIENAVLFKRR
jgi:hypothetical protein